MTTRTKPDAKPRYVTTTDVAVYFSVTPNTISRWRHLRHDPLPYVVLPGMKHPRFDLEEVQAWADRRFRCA